MKFLTREWYDSIQGRPGGPTEAEIEQWARRIDEKLISLGPPRQLPTLSAQRLGENILHDATVRHWQATRKSLKIWLAHRGHGLQPCASLELTLLDICNLSHDVQIGYVWLYEEIQHVNNHFELAVLFDKGELNVVCREILLHISDH